MQEFVKAKHNIDQFMGEEQLQEQDQKKKKDKMTQRQEQGDHQILYLVVALLFCFWRNVSFSQRSHCECVARHQRCLFKGDWGNSTTSKGTRTSPVHYLQASGKVKGRIQTGIYSNKDSVKFWFSFFFSLFLCGGLKIDQIDNSCEKN